MIQHYFTFGAGFYIGMTVKNPGGFTDATAAGLIRGFLLGFVFWPVGLIVAVVFAMVEPNNGDANEKT